MDYTVTKRRLLESGGKLLMVRRQQYTPCLSTRLGCDIEEDNYEVDDDSDLDIFVGDHFSTTIFGCEEASEEFICHFVDENDVVYTIPKTYEELLESKSMWFSPREILV